MRENEYQENEYRQEENYAPSRPMSDEEYDEEQRRIRRQQKIARMRREKQRYERRMKMIQIGIPTIIVLVIVIWGATTLIKHRQSVAERNESWTPSETKTPMEMQEDGQVEDMLASQTDSAADGSVDGTEATAEGLEEIDETSAPVVPAGAYYATEAESMETINEEVVSTSAIVIDRDGEKIIAQRGGKERINPASMTKILTVLVAAEHVTDLDDTVTITRDVTDFSFTNDCSIVGFDVDEQVTVKDLMYGTILPSGADAGIALAKYVAGSHEAFVDMMNEKVSELGLADTTHFTNCVGIYDDNHYSTPYDMAMILEAAVDNPLCREVMNARKYTTSVTEQHPEGILISNWFLRRIEDKDTKGEVVCAKTGYVVQSGNCAASYSEGTSGKRLICVTAGSTSSWRCIYDHVAIYQQFMRV